MIFHTCAVANEQKRNHLDKKREETFITTDFINWKKSKEKFQGHSTSVMHCCLSELLSNTTHTNELMSDIIAAEKKVNTCCLMKILQNAVFLERQGLGLHGDGDNKSENFYQLMLLRALDDPSLLKWINRSYNRHMNSTSQNEILKLLALKLLCKL